MAKRRKRSGPPRSLTLPLTNHQGGQSIVASCYDSESIFREKYPGSAGNIRALKTLGATVLFGIDATKLHEETRLQGREKPFDRIVFNFPHSGSAGSTKESVASNQELLQGYFVSASLIVEAKGQVHLTLRDTHFYQSWEMPKQAEDGNLYLIHKEPFQADLFVGYEVARTASSELMRQAPSTDDAFIYCFALSSKHPRRCGIEEEKLPEGEESASLKRKRPLKKKKLSTDASFDCHHCGVKMATQAKWNGHINSPKHSKALKAAKKATNLQKQTKPPKKKAKKASEKASS